MTDTSTALGWSFDPVSSRYRDTVTGQYIASSDVTALRNHFLDAQAAQVQQLAADLAADSLSVSEWETAMRAVVQDTLGVEYVFGRGGLNMMAVDDWQALGDLVASQFGYLNGFAQDIADGELSEAQIAARSVLYLGAGIGAYERGAAASTDIELPEYPGDSCEGMTSCRCYWDLEPSDDGGVLATWIAVGDSTTCEPCESNAAEWNPLAFGPDGVEKSMPHERNHTDIPLTGGAQPMTRELLRAEISKIDDEQQIVFGWASVSVGKDGALLVDRQDDVIFPEDLEHAAYDFVLNSRQADSSHDQVTKAHLVESMVFTAEKMALMGIAFVDDTGAVKKSDAPVGAWWCAFFVPSVHVWKSIKDGEFAAFSIGGFAVREPMQAES